MQELCIDDRQTGVMVGQRWMDAGVFYHVAKTEMFADADKLYRFDQDEITTILNMKEVLQGPAQPAEAVVRYLEAAVDACVR